MKKFYLMPIDGRKSFNNKCYVEIDNNENKTLFSYTTAICVLTNTGVFKMLYNGENNDGKLSQTTNRHLNAFKQFYGI